MRTKILITGSTGFLGSHLTPLLKKIYGKDHVIGICSSDFDLLQPEKVEDMFIVYKPEIIIHLAAYSGGIGANREFPADFFYKNNLFVTLMFDAAAKHKVKKLIYTMGGCSYPSNAISPISENQMWDGYPQKESAGYSIAKKTGLVASNCYREQYGLDSTVLIPGNMYGEYDNYRIGESHVVPGMLRRYFEAKLNKVNKIEMWGDGSPARDFVYVNDVAQLIPWFIENYNSSDPINISTGTSTTIYELANLIKLKMSWDGEISWDKSKPNGQLTKIFDTKKLNDLGLICPTSLNEGLSKTIDWFENNYRDKSDRIRL